MKVLAISASPRTGGNSDLLCENFLEGAKAAGHKIEKIRLSGLNLQPCKGCDVCIKKGRCKIEDDFHKLSEAMLVADVIMFATPIYFYSICSQLKMIMDRSYSMYRTLKNKRFYFALSVYDNRISATDGALVTLRDYISCLPGAKEEGVLLAIGVWQKGDVVLHSTFKQAFEMGHKL